MNPYIGQMLDDRYELLEVIGTGGMAVVYKAKCHRLNRLVAVKILKDEFSGDEDFRRRFRAEGQAVAMLSHPNIVQVFDVSATDEANYIVMELIDGISLKQYMEVKGILNWKETLHFATQIAKGLEHAHSRGIVHRDIKPHNVMVLKNGSVKVMDFGIAQVMNKSSTLTKEALGSVHYISPEQAKGSFTDNRSDLYSLGVVMYEMMAGRPPYDGESPVAVAIQHINGGAVPPSSYNPNIPRALEQIIMHAMELEAKNRYATATELLADLEEFRKNPTIILPYASPTTERPRPKPPVQSQNPGAPAKPRNTAEKVVRSKGGTIDYTGQMPRTQNPAPKPRQNTANLPVNNRDVEAVRRAQQRRKEEERREAERSRIATIAVVVCSLVAVVAIAVFLVAIFNGTLLSQERELVDVPYLVGLMYSEDIEEEYPDLNIRLQPQKYSDNYIKGQIMSQEPVDGKVAKGADLFITVSMGEEPARKIMEDLVGVTLDRAYSFLTGQGFTVLIREYFDENHEAGVVFQTEPAATAELVEGQTIKIWVSKGPEVILGKMPYVVGIDKERAKLVLESAGFANVIFRNVASDEVKGQVVAQSEKESTDVDVTKDIYLDISEGPKPPTARMPDVLGMKRNEAVDALKKLGFENVRINVVPSSMPKDMVLRQSYPRQTELELTMRIELDVSEGTTETEPPTTVPPTTVPKDVSYRFNFTVPEREEAYVLTIYQSGFRVMEPVTIQPGQTTYEAQLTGSGTVSYDLYVDNEFLNSQKVTFPAND